MLEKKEIIRNLKKRYKYLMNKKLGSIDLEQVLSLFGEKPSESIVNMCENLSVEEIINFLKKYEIKNK